MPIVTQPIDSGVDIPAGQYVTVGVCPAEAKAAAVNVRLVSRDLARNIKVRLAVVPLAFVDGATPPADTDWIQPVDLVLGPNGVAVGILEDSGIVLSPGRKIVAYSDVGYLTARIHGYLKVEV